MGGRARRAYLLSLPTYRAGSGDGDKALEPSTSGM